MDKNIKINMVKQNIDFCLLSPLSWRTAIRPTFLFHLNTTCLSDKLNVNVLFNLISQINLGYMKQAIFKTDILM